MSSLALGPALESADDAPPASSVRLAVETENVLAHDIELAEAAMAQLLTRSPACLRELGCVGDEVRKNPKLTRDALRGSAGERRKATATSWALLTQTLEAAGRAAEGALGSEDREALGRDLVSLRLHRRVLDRAASAVEPKTLVAAGLRRAQERADQSKARLVEAHLHLAVAIARRFRRRGVDLADLVQEGTIGLVRAGDKFDHRRGIRFGTYAAWWVRQQITRALVEHRAGVRVPLETANARMRVGRAARVFQATHGREPTLAELAHKSGLPPALVSSVRHLASDTISLHGDPDAAKPSLEEVLHDADMPRADDALATERMKARLLSLLATLPARDGEILRLRFGLGESKDLSLKEVGARLRLSRERVRRLEVRALKKLHELSSRENLDSYLTE